MSDAAKVNDILRECGTFYLATIDGDQARVRPFGAECVFEGRLYITTSNQKRVWRQMLANPKVELCGMVGERWVRVTGTVEPDGRREALEAMLEANPSLRELYSVDDGKFAVLRFVSGSATVEAFGAEPQTYEL